MPIVNYLFEQIFFFRPTLIITTHLITAISYIVDVCVYATYLDRVATEDNITFVCFTTFSPYLNFSIGLYG